MNNIEQGPKEPEEQTPEQILEIIREAIENGRNVLLVQQRHNGSLITNLGQPISIEGNNLTIESAGYGFDIKISSIKSAGASLEKQYNL